VFCVNSQAFNDVLTFPSASTKGQGIAPLPGSLTCKW
jgi:hypothetical protein